MWRAALKILAWLLLTLAVVPLAWLLSLTRRDDYILRFSQAYFRAVALIIGVRLHVEGQLNPQRPLLLVSNHISYLDIVALSAAAPVTFTPKSEIASWPLIGFLSRLMGCVFIDRRRSQTKTNMGSIHAALTQGKPLILFAEGTTGDGKRLLPIRSSYFQLAEEFQQAQQPLHIQPVLLRYTRVHNLPLDETSRYRIAWVGDETLMPHLFKLLQLGTIDVSVRFQPVIDVSGSETRKDIARKCQASLTGAMLSL